MGSVSNIINSLLKRGITLQAISVATDIPISVLEKMQKGQGTLVGSKYLSALNRFALDYIGMVKVSM